MKKILFTLIISFIASPVYAVTKPTDMVNIITWVTDAKQNLIEKNYPKAWKDLKMEAGTRQKILQKEKEIQSKYGLQYRVYAIRVNPNGGEISAVLYISSIGAIFYDISYNKTCSINLLTYGAYIDGSGCQSTYEVEQHG